MAQIVKMLYILVILIVIQNVIYPQPSQDEQEIKKKAEVFITNGNFIKAEEEYNRLISIFPTKENYILVGHFYAKQEKFKKAVQYFYEGYDENSEETKLEQVFYDYQLYDELLKLYLKKVNEADTSYDKHYFFQRVIKIYKLQSNNHAVIKYILSIIEWDQYQYLIEKEFPAIDFQYFVLDKINNEQDKEFILSLYEKKEKYQLYLLKDDISSQQMNRLINILMSVQYKKSNYQSEMMYYYNILIELAQDEKYVEEITSGLENLNNKKLTLLQHFMIEQLLGKIYYQTKQYNKSVQFYQKMISRGLSEHNDVKDIIVQFQIEYQYYHCIKIIDTYLDLLDQRRKVKKSNGQYLEILLQKGLFLLELKDFIKAKKIFEEITYYQTDENFDLVDQSYFNLGKIYFSKNDYDQAREYYSKIKGITEPSSTVLIARCHIAKKEYGKAKQYLQSVRKDGYAQYYLSLVYLFEGNIQECIIGFEDFIVSVKHNPLSVEALEKLEILYLIEEDKDKLDQFIQFEILWDSEQYSLLLSKEELFTQEPLLKEIHRNYYRLKYAQIYMSQQKYQSAIDILTNIRTTSYDSFSIEKSSFLLGKLYIQNLRQKEKGVLTLLELIRNYPDTIFLFSAQQLINNNLDKNQNKT